MSQISYAFKEAFNNLGRNALVVLGAILAVFISLTLTFGTVVFGEVVRVNTLQWAQDILKVPVEKIHQTKVLQTVLRGNTVYEAEK